MTDQKITPVILCGGSDTRLWPLSRKSFLNQFVPLIDHKSLLQLTLERVAQMNGDGVTPEISCIAAEEHRFLVHDAMQIAGTISDTMVPSHHYRYGLIEITEIRDPYPPTGEADPVGYERAQSAGIRRNRGVSPILNGFVQRDPSV